MAAGPLVERVTFSGGEIGPALRARADLARYQVSVEKMENYLIMVEGGATRRPGTRFVLPLRVETQKGKLVPFRLTQTDHYMLVFNGATVRFMRDGGFLESSPGVPYDLVGPYAEADLPNLRTVARGNVIFAACVNHRLRELTRIGLVSWTISDYVSNEGPFDAQNLDTNIAISSSANAGVTSLVATGTGPFLPGHVNALWRIDDGNLSLVANWKGAETGLAVGDRRRYNGNVYEVAPGSGASAGNDPPTHLSGDVLSVAGGVLWRFRHGPYGIVRITSVSDANHAVGTVITPIPDSDIAPAATYRWWPPAWSDAAGWPTVLAWSSERMFFFRGDRFWASGLIDPHDMLEDGTDDRAFSGRLLSPDPNGANVDITWAVTAGALVVGTSDVEWIFRAASGVFEAVTAKTIKPVPDSNEGSSAQIPVLVDGGVMFVGKSGRRLQYAKIDPDGTNSQRLDVQEVSVGARHITLTGVGGLAWERDLSRVLWVITGGGLAALTWMPREKVLAWHRHPMTNGVVEEVGVIASTATGLDDVYMIVRRTIAGVTRRYVEFLEPLFLPVDPATAAGAWFVDCGLRQQFGSAVSIIAGLDYLEGESVRPFVDGAQQPLKTVLGGQITLAKKGKDVLVGLPIRAEILDLPRNVTTQTGPSTGEKKAAREVNVHLYQCGGGTIGTQPRTGTLPVEKLIETGGKDYAAPIKLFIGLKRMTVECETDNEFRLQLINDDAMPCTVLGMSPHVEVEETD